MAKQTVQVGKGKTPDAVKAKGPQDGKASNPAKAQDGKAGEETKKEKAPGYVIPVVKAGALSVEVGPAAVAMLAKAYQDEAKTQELMQGIEQRRKDAISTVVLGIKKAAEVDKSIDLSVAFGADKKAQGKLNDQVLIALGVREVVESGDKERLVYSKAVQKFFPSAKDDKNDPITKQKSTLRSNFLHLVKKAQQVAAGLIEKNISAKHDKASGTLQLSGPAVRQQFGTDTVLLDEKITVNEGNTAIKLLEKPSFQAIANRAAEAHGAQLKGGTPQAGQHGNTRGARPEATTPNQAVQNLCKMLVQALGRLTGDVDATTQVAMRGVVNSIGQKLGTAPAGNK